MRALVTSAQVHLLEDQVHGWQGMVKQCSQFVLHSLVMPVFVPADFSDVIFTKSCWFLQLFSTKSDMRHPEPLRHFGERQERFPELRMSNFSCNGECKGVARPHQVLDNKTARNTQGSFSAARCYESSPAVAPRGLRVGHVQPFV